MSSTDWKPVATVLVSSWPSQVASWGREVIAGYCTELAARDVTPEQALVALRSCGPEQRFPPSVPELAALTRVDPGTPTCDEMYEMVYGRRGVLKARPEYPPGGWTGDDFQVAQDRLAVERADSFHPLLGAFVRTQTLRRLRMLPVDGDHGELVRKDLGKEWDQFVATTDRRDVAAIAAGVARRTGLRRLNPLDVVNGRPVPELEAGT